MKEKTTADLEKVLKSTHHREFSAFRKDHVDSLSPGGDSFSSYIKELFRQKKLTQQMVFLRADIPERYGYKLLSGEKHTRQRDVILRICYAGELTLEETQRALKKYEMPTLYAKNPRDAFLMILFEERPGGIIEINSLLKENSLEPLRTSGVQD